MGERMNGGLKEMAKVEAWDASIVRVMVTWQ